MGKTKLRFQFHDPNPSQAAGEQILKVFIQAAQRRLERMEHDTAQEQFLQNQRRHS